MSGGGEITEARRKGERLTDSEREGQRCVAGPGRQESEGRKWAGWILRVCKPSGLVWVELLRTWRPRETRRLGLGLVLGGVDTEQPACHVAARSEDQRPVPCLGVAGL